MQSMVDVVVAKYMRPPQATEFMEYLLRLALYDLEEVWADELTACQHALEKERKLTEDLRIEKLSVRDNLTEILSRAQLEVESHILREDVLEAENARLKAQMQAQ